MQESFVLEITETEDSCVYIYDNGKEDIEWVNHHFVIDKRKDKLYYYFNDNQDIIEAKKTGEKVISVRNKKQVIECYMNEGRGDLFYLFFTEGYGLLLMKFFMPENVLIKFDNKISEINDMIDMIKADNEFYEWGGREHFDPPPID